VVLRLGKRFIDRKRAHGSATESDEEDGCSVGTDDCSFDHLMDPLALMLSVSPMVWEHHDVVVLPTAPAAGWSDATAIELI
jgi:hypothetical protein